MLSSGGLGRSQLDKTKPGPYIKFVILRLRLWAYLEPDMWSFVSDNYVTIVLFAALVSSVAWAIWIVRRNRHSKATFALSIVTSLITCLSLFLRFLFAGSLPGTVNAALTLFDYLLGLHTSPANTVAISAVACFLAAAVTVVIVVLIYRTGTHTIRNWDGPVTVTVNELAKANLDNDMLRLARAEFIRILARKTDPLASDIAVNWQRHIASPPDTPAWHIQARRLIELYIGEVDIPDSGWRDLHKVWVGAIYATVPPPSTKSALYVFVFERNPNDEEVARRVHACFPALADAVGATLYAIFPDEVDSPERSIDIDGLVLTVISNLTLLKYSLPLGTYARDLLRRFDIDTLGGTSATLRDTYVECHVAKDSTSDPIPVSTVLREWKADNTRRHLAITAEYGRGKSTAMLAFCVDWARAYLDGTALRDRVPLLIELRGHTVSG